MNFTVLVGSKPNLSHQWALQEGELTAYQPVLTGVQAIDKGSDYSLIVGTHNTTSRLLHRVLGSPKKGKGKNVGIVLLHFSYSSIHPDFPGDFSAVLNASIPKCFPNNNLCDTSGR